jgi:hypothetical protein
VIVASIIWGVVAALMPFVVLMAFWIILMKTVRGRGTPSQDAVIEKLDEIRDEIRRLRKAVEQKAPDR